MEQYKTKNKVLNSILDPVVSHYLKSNFNSRSNVFVDLENTVRKVWLTTVHKQNSINTDKKSQINNFFNMYHNIKLKTKVTQIEWKQFVNCLHETLLSIDKYRIDIIEQSLMKCQIQLDELENSLIPSYLKTWFKEFCISFCHILPMLNNRVTELVSESVGNNILLYMFQMVTCLQQFFKLFKQEVSHKVLVIASRRYLIKRLIYCFDGIRKNLNIDNDPEELNSGFIQWMDNALDLISDLKINEAFLKSMENVKNSIEEVLCHAMSIAQICADDDLKKVKASVQTVLHEFNQLDTECKKSNVNPSVCNLYVDVVSDKLCLLERRVNTAVLNIALKTFSEYFEPLSKLQTVCEENDTSIFNRSENDLNYLVTNLDAHVERIIQVGLFAIACSTNTTIIAKIRSYLASLESLECELIPALTTLYMEPSNISCLHANLCVSHWREEVKHLSENVCFIIDPVAFGQVLLDDLKTRINDLDLNDESILTKDMLTPLRKRTKIFILIIKACVIDMKLKENSVIVQNQKNLNDIYRELRSAIELLPTNKDPQFNKRILKRIQILFTMIERVTHSFANYDKNMTKTINIETSPLKMDAGNDAEIIDKIDVNDLQDRGLKLLKERSVLYKTPNKSRRLLPITPGNKNNKFTDKRKLGISFVRNIVLPSCDSNDLSCTMDLQITEILEKITSLANTLL